MMRNLCKITLLIAIFTFSACNNDEEFSNPNVVKIEKEFPFFVEKADLENINAETVELFMQNKIHIISSIEDLNDCLLLNYFPYEIRQDFFTCNFEKHTLLFASTANLYKIEDIKYRLVKEENPSEYTYSQTLYTNREREEKDLYFVGTAFMIEKISSNSKIEFWSGVISTKK